MWGTFSPDLLCLEFTTQELTVDLKVYPYILVLESESLQRYGKSCHKDMESESLQRLGDRVVAKIWIRLIAQTWSQSHCRDMESELLQRYGVSDIAKTQLFGGKGDLSAYGIILML